MTTPEEWMTIKTFNKKYLSQRRIASTLGISRNRVEPYPMILDKFTDHLK